MTAPLTDSIDDRRCLNCGEALHGAFCGACGQRSVPANPTVLELAGDAWQELSGYDGRIAATFRGLLHPGRLTLEYLQGRRARYLSPVRLYLTVSVVYFVVAAAAPNLNPRDASSPPGTSVTGPGGIRIAITGAPGQVLTDEDRRAIHEYVEQSHWLIRPMLRAVETDPEGFRARMFATVPRVFFVLLPVFAAIVSLFYRRQRFPAALVFAVHLHALAFLIFAVAEASKFTRSAPIAGAVGVTVVLTFIIYILMSLRRVFGGGWPATLAKAIGIGVLYLVASLPAFFALLLWASVV